MLYQGESCPVCKRQFEENDDVVFCPECGTPHHRECYQLTGHCVNRALHKTGYDYRKEHAPAIEAEKEKESAPHNHRGIFPPEAEAQDNSKTVFNITDTPYDKDTDTIDGESVGDVAAAVRSNTVRFINIFKKQEKTGKKAGWNWCAFIFGAYYLFYRKMYKQAITLFCINITLSSLSSMLTYKFAPLSVKAINEILALGGSNPDVIAEKMNGLQSVADVGTFTAIMLGFWAANIIIRITVAVFADSIYKSSVTSFVKRVNEQLRDGASFNAPMLTPQEEEQLSLGQEQMKRIYLVRKGGTSIWAPFAAYMILTLINYITGAR